MRAGIFLLLLIITGTMALGQKPKAPGQWKPAGNTTAKPVPPGKMTIAQMKTAIEQSGNGPLYVKDVLKKKFKLDTIIVRRTWGFLGLADSLAYHGEINKVYGPYDKGKFLVQVLAKNPNLFNHIGQIYIDTAVLMPKVADSLADNIMQRIREGSTSFEEMAVLWSMGGEAATRGDIGWVAMGAMIPEIEKELKKRKKGEIFKVWTKAGLHIIRKTDNPEEKDGYALMMRIFL
ncbi:MAG: peptidylprolyl isomerase [Chitinophagaceae bacterium]|nr:peptidylprolyl isomerase [Chitinophagaceae bacterium]